MPKGGPRPGAGGKPGYQKRRSATTAAQIASDGKELPMHVMIRNMRIAVTRQQTATGECLKLIKDFLAGTLEEKDPDKLLDTFRAALFNEANWMKLSQDFANDAAKFFHAQLQSIEMNIHDDRIEEKSEDELLADLNLKAKDVTPGVLSQLVEDFSKQKVEADAPDPE